MHKTLRFFDPFSVQIETSCYSSVEIQSSQKMAEPPATKKRRLRVALECTVANEQERAALQGRIEKLREAMQDREKLNNHRF